MKVISVSHLFPNSVFPNYGVFIKERLRALSRLVDLDIVAPIPYFPFIPKYRKFHEVSFEEMLEFAVVYHPRYILVPKFFKWSDGYLYRWSVAPFFYDDQRRIENVNILDFHWVYPDAFAGLKWAKKFDKKIIVTIRGNESISYFENSLRKSLVGRTLRKVDYIISVSNDLKQKIIEEYGVNKDKVSVVLNGIQADKFKMIDKKFAIDVCGLEHGKKYILSVSRLSHEKGLKYLLEAFAAMGGHNTVLLIVGDGPLKRELFSMATALQIDNKVRFVGTVPHDQIMFWYNAADVYCLSSLWEGCPNVIIESLACGTPVVATAVGGIPDLVPNDDYGFLVPAKKPSQLAEALDAALMGKWDREKIARYGSRNTWDDVARNIFDIFQSVSCSF